MSTSRTILTFNGTAELMDNVAFQDGAWIGNRSFSPGDLQVMQQDRVQVTTIQQLRQFVSRTLCRQNDFEEDIFQISERLLTRGDRPCGIFFCLHGPRSVKLTAVWETESNSILFYGATGERFQKTMLAQALPLASPMVE